MSQSDDDEIITVRPEDKLTNPPDPNAFIDIHIINENQVELARAMRLFLQSRFYAERTARIESLAAIPPASERKVSMHILVLCVDETIDLDESLRHAKRVYSGDTKVIIHSDHPLALVDILLWDETLSGSVTGYDFRPLAELIEALAASIPKI